MKAFRTKLVLSLASATIAQACVSSAVQMPVTDMAEPEAAQEYAADAARPSPQSPDVLSLDSFQPRALMGGCDVRALPRSDETLPPKLQAAIAQARAYSAAQKGVSLLIVRDGKVIHESYEGEADESTWTDSYSMMKSLTGLMTGIAIEKGLIGSLDDPSGKYLSEWADDPRGQISIRQLLTMQSGLRLYPFGDPAGESMKLMFASDINGVALKTPLQDEPGAVFRYNNVNSQIVGAIIDRAAKAKGMPGFIDMLHDDVWCPLGNGEAALWLDREGGSPHYFAGAFARAADWARIGELFRNRGKANGQRIVSPEWVDAMTSPSAKNAAYGLHIWLGKAWQRQRRYSQESQVSVLHSARYLADDVVFFDGFGGQRVYVIPSSKLTIVRTGFANFNYDDAMIVNLLLAAL
ncbi:serine hydrolase domain-containing protein [Sphingorhabdus sp. 109]|jgi:CubicO group peptidase (beta-lactamase class C family)|uniref:serine hydrolase domain-containing protein n=1 Tax=Sphingorhabdus sp. 109 TaxID=2653173 RepID=UPI0012EEF898|nr:serine hydrolase [Sphingorhabdus sp. 109]VWX60707.1 CubicO group peptidase, beta-lactamase class C family [Sphingorhabdus sp. 109]